MRIQKLVIFDHVWVVRWAQNNIDIIIYLGEGNCRPVGREMIKHQHSDYLIDWKHRQRRNTKVTNIIWNWVQLAILTQRSDPTYILRSYGQRTCAMLPENDGGEKVFMIDL